MLVALLIPVEDCDCSFAFDSASILSVNLKGTRPFAISTSDEQAEAIRQDGS